MRRHFSKWLGATAVASAAMMITLTPAQASKCWTPEKGYMCLDDEPARPQAPAASPSPSSNLGGLLAKYNAALSASLSAMSRKDWKSAELYGEQARDAAVAMGEQAAYDKSLSDSKFQEIVDKQNAPTCFINVASTNIALQTGGAGRFKGAPTYNDQFCGLAFRQHPAIAGFVRETQEEYARQMREISSGATANSTIDNILEGRKNTNSGRNDSGQAVAPIAPPQVQTRPTTALPKAPPRENVQDDHGTGVDQEVREAPAQKAANQPTCGVSDVVTNLGKCVARKAKDLRERTYDQMDKLKAVDVDDVFPSKSSSSNPF